MKKIYVIVFTVLAALIFNPLQASSQVFRMANPNVGKTAENFTLPVLDGGEMSLKEFRGKKKAIVFFWATWCPHCREALAKLDKRKDEIDGLDIKVILVDVGESKGVVSKYVANNNISMNIFLDEATEATAMYGVVGIPTFYFIGEDGVIRKVQNSLPEDLESIFYGS